LLGKAAVLRQAHEPNKRGTTLALVHERLRIGLIGDLTAEPDFVCAVEEIVAAAYENPDDYWHLWIDYAAARVGLPIEHFLAVHAAPDPHVVARYERMLTENESIRALLLGPGTTLREGLIALAADPDYGFLVCQELQAYLMPANAAPEATDCPARSPGEAPPPEPAASARPGEITRWLDACAVFHYRNGQPYTELFSLLFDALWCRLATDELDDAETNDLRHKIKQRVRRTIDRLKRAERSE
jgi:hypothetical protein